MEGTVDVEVGNLAEVRANQKDLSVQNRAELRVLVGRTAVATSARYRSWPSTVIQRRWEMLLGQQLCQGVLHGPA